MRALRAAALVVVASVVALGFVLDQEERERDALPAPVLVAAPVAEAGTWFCAGGSTLGGAAAIGLEITNPHDAPVSVRVEVLRSDSEEPAVTDVIIEPASRSALALTNLALQSPWVAAIVETGDAAVVVEQTADGPTGTDRSPCATRTSTSFAVPDGATRLLAHGEDLTLVLMNPFHEDAVVDIQFDADVGPDDLEAVVVPARRVVAISVTDEVTVAERVSAVLEVTAGRIVVNRVQVRNSEVVRGLAVTPAVADGSAVSVLTTARRSTDQRDTVYVTNLSSEASAEVDLEIVTDGSMTPDPIELTLRPGRTVAVDLTEEMRLDGLDSFAIIVRSLGGGRVAAMVESVVEVGSETVVGVSAAPAIDAAATSWIAPLENGGELAIVNPSRTSIATVTVALLNPTGTTELIQTELGPGRRLVVDAASIEADRPVIVVNSNAPVVVGREIVGFTSRQLAGAIIASDPVPVGAVD